MSRRCLRVLVILLSSCPVGAALTVTNHAPRELLRYPVALLVGTAERAERVAVDNLDNPRPDGRNVGPVVDQRFRLLVELAPGDNRLRLSAGAESAALTLTYRPPTSPYRVTLVYLTGREGATAYPTQFDTDRQDYLPRVRTGARLLQTFCAESLHDEGLGRLTFNLATDERGEPAVHTVALPEPANGLRARDPSEQWHRTYECLSQRFDFARTKVLCFNAFVAYDADQQREVGHKSLGGGSQAVCSSGSLCAWPASLRDVQRAFDDATPVDTRRVADVTAFRGTLWALAATGLGTCLHELGHTFGLPHSPDPRCPMSRGFDQFNRTFVVREAPSRVARQPVVFRADETARWDPLFAQRLALNPWWQADARPASGLAGPSVAYHVDRAEFLVHAPAGLACVQASGPLRRIGWPLDTAAGDTDCRVSLTALRDRLGATEAVSLVVFDREGRSASATAAPNGAAPNGPAPSAAAPRGGT